MQLTVTPHEHHGLMKAVFLGLLSLADRQDGRASTVSIRIFWQMWDDAGPVERELFANWVEDTLADEGTEILEMIINRKEGTA